MTVLHIDEYSLDLPARSTSIVPVYPVRITTQPKITTSASSQPSAAVNNKTKFVSIRPIGGPVYINIGANPTASATSKYLSDGEVYDVAVAKGDKIAVIDA